MDYTPISLPSVADDKKSSLVGMSSTELGKGTSSTLLCSNMWKSRTQDLLLCRVSTLKGAEHLSYTLDYLGCKPVEAKVQRWKALLTSKESQSTTQGGVVLHMRSSEENSNGVTEPLHLLQSLCIHVQKDEDSDYK